MDISFSCFDKTYGYCLSTKGNFLFYSSSFLFLLLFGFFYFLFGWKFFIRMFTYFFFAEPVDWFLEKCVYTVLVQSGIKGLGIEGVSHWRALNPMAHGICLCLCVDELVLHSTRAPHYSWIFSLWSCATSFTISIFFFVYIHSLSTRRRKK